MEPKRVSRGGPWGPFSTLFGEPVPRSFLGHFSYDPQRSGRSPWGLKSEDPKGSYCSLTRQRSPSFFGGLRIRSKLCSDRRGRSSRPRD